MSIGNLYFQLEILVGELLFLYSCPKRKYFWLRLVAVCAVCLGVAYIYPMPEGLAYYPLFALVRFLALFALSYVGMLLCFDIKPFVTFSLCCSGYAFQHIGYNVMAVFINTTLWSEEMHALWQVNHDWVELISFIVVYAVLWLIFARPVAKKQLYKTYDKRLSVIGIFIILLCVGLTRIARAELFGMRVISVSLYTITCCVLALVIQYNIYNIAMLISENVVMRRLREEDKRQYEITKATIENINVKCHDLKHRLNDLKDRISSEEMQSMTKAIEFYDNTIKTENDVLNLVLMDNLLRYGSQNIRFSLMGDGGALNFVKEIDLASLLGNAISNAVEAAVGVSEVGKRNIGISITRTGNMVTLSIRNYFNGEIKQVNGELVTTKAQNKKDHGFGVKSIRRTAQKYGGDVSYSIDEDIFTLTVYMFDATATKSKATVA